MSRRQAFAVSVALGVLTVLLLTGSSWNDSPSWDEPEHVTAGFTYLTYGWFLLNPMHPPLMKDLAGLAVEVVLAPPPLPGWPFADRTTLVHQLFTSVDAQTLIRTARMPLILCTALFVGAFFLTLWERHGGRPALLGCALLLLNPLFLAHGSQVHNDVLAAGLTYLSLWFLVGHLLDPGDNRRAGGLALVLGFAQIAKFSCLILYPVYLLSGFLCSRKRAFLKRVPLVLGTGVVVVTLAYVVHPAPSDFQALYRDRSLTRGIPTPAVTLLEWAGDKRYLRRLNWYVTGLLRQGRHVAEGHDYPLYLQGKLYPQGSFHYFPVLLACKTPLGVGWLLLLALGGLRRVWDRETQVFGLYIGLYLLIALNGSLNIGLRHLLPIIPLLSALFARALCEEIAHRKSRKYEALVAAGLLAATLSLATAWPNYIGYFNVLSRHKVVAVDSDFDWGTDLLRLQRRIEEQGWRPFTIHYFGHLSPKVYLGSETEILNPKALPETGYLGVSATLYLPLMARDSLTPEGARYRDWLRQLEVVEWVGAILILKLPENGEHS